MYSLEYDRAAGIIRMVVTGFWDVETVEACTAELLPLMSSVRAEKRPVLVLSDARNFPVQSSEVATAFARMEQATGSLRHRMAMVVGSVLAKMQGERAVAGSETQFFSAVEEAEAWLLGHRH